MDHLVRRGGRYYYRRRVPTGLVVALGMREVMKALGTSDPTEARSKARMVAVQMDALFAKAAGGRSAGGWEYMLPEEWGDPNEAATEAEADRDAKLKAWFMDTLERIIGGAAQDMRTALQATLAQASTTPTPERRKAPQAPEKSISDDSRDWADVLREWERKRSPAPSSVQSSHKAVAYLWEACGRIKPQQVNRGHLAKLEAHLQKAGKAPGTVLAQITYVKTLLTVAVDMQLIAANPWLGARASVTRRTAKDARMPFSASDLRTVLARCSKEARASRKWVPYVALYTGMRLEEIGQLAPSDIRLESFKDASGKVREVHVIYVTDEGEGQGLKNAASRRRIPVHPELVRLGFITYASSQTGARLFPELKAIKGGRETSTLSRWFGLTLRNDCGITDKRKTFHSFRHTFKDVLREHGVPEDVSDALSGHTNGSVARNYGGAYYPLRPLVEALDRYEIHGL